MRGELVIEMPVWVAVLVMAGSCWAQTPLFDVASVKPSAPPEGDTYRANLGTVRHGELVMTNVTLSDCLRFAYRITNDLQIAGPDWTKDKAVRFDIQAKTGAEVPVEQFPLMLQGLLAERFEMKIHHETRQLGYVAMEVGKKGAKLREAVEGSDASGNRNGGDRIISNHMSMQLLATLLSRFLRETVIDQTGMKGFYEVKLEWTPDNVPVAEAGSGPSVFTAIQAQLGLKLEARKGPLDVVVVDGVRRVPIAN